VLELFRKLLGKGSPGEADSPRRPKPDVAANPFPRASNGLDHFFESLRPSKALEVLDLGGLNESNVHFLSELGGKMHAVDLLECYDGDRRENPDRVFDPVSARDFVDEYLNFARNQFDAILVWDALEFLDPELLYPTVARLGETLRSGGGLLTFFHTQSRGQTVQVYRYRIRSRRELLLQPRQLRTLPNTFNNRSLERLFGDFESVKFFLTRDNLREVIAVR
jgi:hypothetical protein